MSNTIQKPDANPVVSALLTAFVLMSGHVLINGQTRKWVMNIVANLIGTMLCCLPGFVVFVLSVIDAYQTAERLQKGEVIGENEYTHPTLYKIVKMIDKTATCANAEAGS